MLWQYCLEWINTMKNKELSDIEQVVEKYITVDCIIPYSTVYKGEQQKDNWNCDAWLFTINNQSFNYFTGLGHREKNTPALRGQVAYGFQGLTYEDKEGKTVYGRKYLAKVEASRKPQNPAIAGLLYSLILDGTACNESFAAWCDNFGYDTDSRKALETYEQCKKGFDKLRKVLSSGQIEHVRKLLEDY